MNKTYAIFPLVMCAFGFTAGSFVRNQVPVATVRADMTSVSKSETRNPGKLPVKEAAEVITLPQVKSDETLETLIAQGQNVTYAGLALWLIDASGPDIAAYWKSYINSDPNGDSNGDIRRLLLYNWTRVDPQAAVSATAGTKWASAPWGAWGAVDPHAALAAANPEQVKSVANGIGQMQPEWLREHFDKIPEDARMNALNGMNTWKEDGDHVARLDFFMAHGMGFNDTALKTLARKNPWAAYDWLEKNDKLDSKNDGPVDLLLAAMKDTHPEDLERLAAMVSPGPMQRKIEDAVIENLLATDPDAALAHAKSTSAPLIAASRLAKVGSFLLASDPEKAFAIAADILTVSPNQLAPQKRIETADGSSLWGSKDNATETFLQSLLIKDPERTLKMTTAGNQTVTSVFRELSGKWAERDLVAYTDWVNRQVDTRIRDAAAGHVVSQLSSQGHFQEAADWAMSGAQDNLYGLAWRWGRSNRGEANAWLESAELEESIKNNLRNAINRNE